MIGGLVYLDEDVCWACWARLGGIALLLALCRLRADPSRPGETAETA